MAREQARGVYVSAISTTARHRALIGRTLSASDDQTVGKGGPDVRSGAQPRRTEQTSAAIRPWWGAHPAIRLQRNHRGVMPSDVMSLERVGPSISLSDDAVRSAVVADRDRGGWTWLAVPKRSQKVAEARARI